MRVHYIENLNITNMRGNDQNVRYIEVIVNDWFQVVINTGDFCENTLVAMSMTYNKPLTEGLLSLYHKIRDLLTVDLFSASSAACWHCNLLYRSRFHVWASGLCSFYRKIRYIKVLFHTFYCNFGRIVIARTSLNRGSLNRSSTVLFW